MATSTLPNVLVIGGFDPSGGAGLLVDVSTLSQIGIQPVAAVTAITAQNSLSVRKVYPVLPQILYDQIEVILADYFIEAVKIGMLGSEMNVEIIAEILARYQFKFIVVDPVFKATRGTHLLEPKALPVFIEKIVPCTTVITPNLFEAEELHGKPIATAREMEKAAETIYHLGATWVLIKGGHLPGSQSIDILYDGQTSQRFSEAKIKGTDVRGTGCIFASALTGYLVQGFSVPAAVEKSKVLTLNMIKRADKIGKGRPQIVFKQ